MLNQITWQFPGPIPWPALLVPVLVLGLGAWLRHLPGEWSQAALLAWTGLLLAFVSALAWPPGLGPWLPALGLVAAMLALVMGGWVGLALLATAHLSIAAAALAGLAGVPWWAVGLTGMIAAAAAFRAAL
jgi:hypothetical protein